MKSYLKTIKPCEQQDSNLSGGIDFAIVSCDFKKDSYLCRYIDMGTTVKIADDNINLLSSVSDEIKLRIINKLSIKDSFGAWNDNRSAEEIIKEIRDARVLGTRNIEPFEE